MSTRCRIGHIQQDGTVRSIYCHHDGYLSYVGKKLSDFYDEKNIDQLLDLGDLSSLGNNPVSNKSGWDMNKLFSPGDEEFCLSYKDRGETGVDARINQNEEDFWHSFGDCGEEYMYLLKDDVWYYMEYGDDEIKLLPAFN